MSCLHQQDCSSINFYGIKDNVLYTCKTTNRYVLQQKRRSSQIVDWAIEKPLYFLLVEVHRNDVSQAGIAHHFSQKFRHNATSLAHFTCRWKQEKMVQRFLQISVKSNVFQSLKIHTDFQNVAPV